MLYAAVVAVAAPALGLGPQMLASGPPPRLTAWRSMLSLQAVPSVEIKATGPGQLRDVQALVLNCLNSDALCPRWAWVKVRRWRSGGAAAAPAWRCIHAAHTARCRSRPHS